MPSITGPSTRAPQRAPATPGDEPWFPRSSRLEPAAATARLVVIEAPPGYGKTALAAELAPEHDPDQPWVWYRLRPSDRDPLLLVTGVLQALRARHPELTVPDLAGDAEAGPIEGLLAATRRALTALTGRLRLVLDDAHLMLPSGHAAALIETLAFPANDDARVVCTSRFPMDLPWAAETSRDRFVTVGPAALAFSAEETRECLRLAGRCVSHQTAAELTEELEGWPAAIRHVARSGLTTAEAVRDLMARRGDTRVAAGLLDDRGLAEFVLRSSVLRRLEPAVCTAAFGQDAAAHLRAAVLANPFVLPEDRHGTRVRYHRVLARILTDILRTREGRAGVRAAHRAAARAWRDEGDEAESVHHLIQAGAWAEVTAVVSERAQDLVTDGLITQVGEWLVGLPPAQLRDNPALSHLAGIVDMHSGYLTEAHAAFLRARDRYVSEGRVAEASLSSYWLASTMLNQPSPLPDPTPAAPDVDPHDQWQPFVDLCVWQSMLLANRTRDAERMRRRAIGHPQARANLPFAAYHSAVDAIYGRRARGDLHGALAQLREAVRLMGRSDPLSRLPVVLGYGALVLWDLRRFDESREWLHRGREEAARRGMTGLNATWFDLMEARLDLREGRVDDAATVLGSLRAQHDAGRFIWRPHQLDLLAAEIELARRGGEADPALVRAAHDSALAFGYHHEIAWVGAELADALAAAGQPGPAAHHAALVVAGCGSDNRHLFTRMRAHLGDLSDSTGTAAEPAPAGLRITTLGDFVVLRDGEPMAAAAWGRRRAKQLFKLLLAAGRPVHGEEIIDLLWPGEQSPEAAQRGLNTTVYWLRRALEPELARGADSRYVVANSGCYQLVLGDGDHCDLIEVRRAADSTGPADDRVRALFDAACREFLPTDRYEPWVEAVADELVRRREQLASRLLATARAARDRDTEIAVLERALDADPWRADVARDLLRRYNEVGRHEAARLLYNRVNGED